jgi:tight adherence protein C
VLAIAMLGVAAMLLCLAAAFEVVRGRGVCDGSPPGTGDAAGPGTGEPQLPGALGSVAVRLRIEARLARAGLSERLSVAAVLVAKLAGTIAGLCLALPAAPAAPGRLSWIVAAGLPAAGFLGPDAWLERRARQRLRALRGGLPDALDLLAVGASAGRSPLAGLAELGTGDGPLARELAVLTAESSCGAPQREALDGLRSRVPVREVAAMCGVIERSRRYGSPLADQLHEQASSLRAVQRRRTEEHAARAAPKIQLAVALLLVPSVLLMIAAGLLANVDRFLAGL